MLACFDAVNFARRIKAPCHYGWGYNNETCPPTSTFSAYNVITAPTTLDIFKEMGHPRIPALTEVEREWVLKVRLRRWSVSRGGAHFSSGLTWSRV